MTDQSTPSLSLPRLFATKAVLLAVALGVIATILLFLSRTGEQDPRALLHTGEPFRWTVAFIGISMITLWGLWSWPRIRARCEEPGGTLIFRGGVLGWGGTMVLLTSWHEAQYLTGRDGHLYLGPRSFLAEVILHALIAWPVYAWLGYWFGYIVFGTTRRMVP